MPGESEGVLSLRLCTPVHEARLGAPEKREVEVTIIRPGRSENGWEYPSEVLKRSLPLWEGATAFCDHPSAVDEGRAGGRSVRDIVGVYVGAHWHEAKHPDGHVPSSRADTGPAPTGEQGVRATLRFYPNAAWLYDLVAAALDDRQAGRPTADIGISADMLVTLAGVGTRQVAEIRKVNSADVVFRPAAGGRFERIVEGLGDRHEAIESIQNKSIQDKKGENVTENAQTKPAGLQTKEAELCTALLEAKLGASKLTELGRQQIRQRFEGQVFAARDLEAAIGEMEALLAEAASATTIRGNGTSRPGPGAVSRMVTPREKVQAALERLFGLEPAAGLGDVPRLSGIREAYLLLTGDREFTGRYCWEDSVLGEASIREANEVTTSVMGDALASVMNKRLVKDYAGQRRWWERICVRVPLRDMKQQSRILLNDFGSLATVAENATYTNLPWGDNKEVYTPAKYGGQVYVTLETIINDDLRAVTSIPKKLAVAANITINEFVSGLFTAGGGVGPTMADANAVFCAAHNNYGTTALGEASLKAGILALWKQTSSAGKRLGLHPRFLLVPPDLLMDAITLTASHLKPGSANNDINVLEGLVEPLPVPNWTDANNWYLMADPAQIECLEIGFLNGREEPELLVQDNPLAGSVFTNDAITFKVRHIYGGAWVDYRGAYGAVVA